MSPGTRLCNAKTGPCGPGALWVKQVTNGLLPRADMLTFSDTDHPGARFAGRRDDAFRLAGDALREEAGYDPARWPHRGWPDGS